VVRSAINDYAAKLGITLKQEYDAENVAGAMSLVASIGGFSLLPLNTTNMLIPSVVVRPLKGVPPTVDLMMGYNKSNMSPLLKRFLSRADELVKSVSQKHGFGPQTSERD
jgi:LysR family hca operon transcriptional activator